MKEYIERERLKEAFNADLQTLQTLDEHTMNLILIEIDEAPTADVAPVRHGRWSSNGIALVCSECGRAFGIVEMFAHYCPWCGSRMDKEDEHEAD